MSPCGARSRRFGHVLRSTLDDRSNTGSLRQDLHFTQIHLLQTQIGTQQIGFLHRPPIGCTLSFSFFLSFFLFFLRQLEVELSLSLFPVPPAEAMGLP